MTLTFRSNLIMGYVVRVLSDFCEKIEISTKYGGEKIEKKKSRVSQLQLR